MALTKLGRYEIVAVHAQGGMGAVYEAVDPVLDRKVALKTIRVDRLAEKQARELEERFRLEVRANGRLKHANIVRVLDAGRDQDLAYLVMDFVDGSDLRHELGESVRFSVDRAVSIMVQLLSALGHAHEKGIVHRDIKPANIMVDQRGNVQLTDFGVARMVENGVTRTHGPAVGTALYMSPEQLRGEDVDGRSDLFAAGIVLYQLITGVHPFDDPSEFTVQLKIAGEPAAPPSRLNLGLPPAIDDVVAKALAKNRADRYSSAQDFAAALVSASRSELPRRSTSTPPEAPTGSDRERSPPPKGPEGGSGQDRQATPKVAQELELEYWRAIKDSEDPAEFEEFIRRFPAGVYESLSRRRLRKLRALAGDASSSGTSSISMRSGSGISRDDVDGSATNAIPMSDVLREIGRIKRQPPVPPGMVHDVDIPLEPGDPHEAAAEAARLDRLRLDEERRRAAESALADQFRLAEQARLAEARRADERRKLQEAQEAERAQRAEEARLAEAQRRAEEARAAEQKRRAEEARMAEQLRQVDEARQAEGRRQAEVAREAERRRQAERTAREAESRNQDELTSVSLPHIAIRDNVASQTISPDQQLPVPGRSPQARTLLRKVIVGGVLAASFAIVALMAVRAARQPANQPHERASARQTAPESPKIEARTDPPVIRHPTAAASVTQTVQPAQGPPSANATNTKADDRAKQSREEAARRAAIRQAVEKAQADGERAEVARIDARSVADERRRQEDARRAEEARLAEEARRAEDRRRSEEAARLAEDKRASEERQRLAEERLTDERRRADQVREADRQAALRRAAEAAASASAAKKPQVITIY